MIMKTAGLSQKQGVNVFQRFTSNFKGFTFLQLVVVNVYMFLALFFFSALIYFLFTQGI